MGVAILSGVFGILGVLVGALITARYETARTKDANDRADALAAKEEAAARRTSARLVFMELAMNLGWLTASLQHNTWWRDEEMFRNSAWLRHQEAIARLLDAKEWGTLEIAYSTVPLVKMARVDGLDLGSGPADRERASFQKKIDQIETAIDVIKEHI